jgi:LysM repeat protein
MVKNLWILSIFAILLTFSAPERPVAAALQEIPNYAFVEGLVGHGQTYPLSCESRSAADLAQYWGLSVSEVPFFESLPVSDNPEKGFVGSVFGTWGQTPPNPYGVHAKPVAKLLRQYGLDAEARRGMTVAEIKTEIANGRPVIVWVVGRVWQGTPLEYQANDGETVIVAQYEHTMIAYGYDLSGIYLMDAGSGARQAYAYSIFKASWSVLGNMAVTAVGTKQAGTGNPNSGSGQQQYIVQQGDYLTKLARQWGISWQDLAALNNISYPYIIYPGQVLLTGLSAEEPESPTPEPTETPQPTSDPVTTTQPTPESTAKPSATLAPKPTNTPQPSETTEPGSLTKTSVYTVQSGDHLMKIARQLGFAWTEIAELNGLTWPYILYPGQQLELPGEGLQTKPPESTPEPTKPLTGGEEPSGSGNGKKKTYTVQKGEHLMQIARKLELSWTAIAQLNQLQSPYVLHPGQVLVLPGADAGPPPPPLPGEQTETGVSASGETYIVKKGEYLYVLAQRFGVNWQVLSSYNQIGYPYQVYPGQVLKIP